MLLVNNNNNSERVYDGTVYLFFRMLFYCYLRYFNLTITEGEKRHAYMEPKCYRYTNRNKENRTNHCNAARMNIFHACDLFDM